MPKKLLLADDSVTIQRVIELTFSGEDVQVLAVGDGEEAIARIPIDRPDIILADIGMPKRSGYEVSAFVKGSPEFEKIPVLLLAGAFEPVDEAKAKEAKCDGVLVKPFEPQHVIARVRELIGGAKGTPAQAVRDIPRPAAALAPSRPVELPKRDERVAIPADLMDMGEDDLLPREDMLPPVQESVDIGSQPIVLDDSLDDYFDKLDEAFATINTTASTAPTAPGADPRPPRPDRPVLETDLESFDEPPMLEPATSASYMEPPLLDETDPFAGIDAIEADAARVPTLDDLLAGMPPGPSPADITFDEAPAIVEMPGIIDFPAPPPLAVVPTPVVIAPPPIEPPDLTPTLTPAPPRPPVAATPARFEETAPRGQAAEPASGRSIIADAFSALFAVEQGEPGATPPRLAGNGASVPPVTDTMIDDVARRVIQRLALGSSEQMQAIVKEIVSGVAERLVREEIERIRNAQRAAGSGQ